MKLTKIGDNQVATSDNFETMSFGIDEKNIGLILETLRSKMYSNPIAAVCREVSSNCRDSHREAGKPNEPVEISIKDGDIFMGVAEDVDATINFIDFGVGISPDRIKNIYLLFGASTKRNDNMQTGGFGYGAKTPFAYSDSFAVVTIFDKKKYTYFFSIGEDRRGDAYLISEEDTNLPNGTTVSIPLKNEDRSKFEYELIRATYFWDVLPRFTGAFTESFKQTMSKRDDSIVFKKEKFFMVNSKSPNAFRSFGFVIDGIYYDYSTTKEIETFKNLVDRTIKTNKLLLRFATGEVSISTNREALYYDKKTIDLILKNSKRYASTLKREYIRGVRKYKGFYYQFANDMSDRYSSTAFNDLYKTLYSFDKKFVEKCTRKYFGVAFSKSALDNGYGSNQEEYYIQAIDSHIEFQSFEKFVAGDKRGRRQTYRFSNIKADFIGDTAPIYRHNNFLERDSIKKNLTIFASNGKYASKHRYYVLTVPNIQDMMKKAQNEFRNKVTQYKNEKKALDPKSHNYNYQLSNCERILRDAKINFKRVLAKRTIFKLFFSEIGKIRTAPLPTYESIPETKIARKASDMSKNAYRAVTLTLGISKRIGNQSRKIKSYEPYGEYREVKLTEMDDTIVIPTKSNNVYQMQQEIRNIVVQTSYIEALGFMYSQLFPKASYVYLVFAKANDYQYIKSINNTQRNVYKLEDFLAKAQSTFTSDYADGVFKSYQKLLRLSVTSPRNYSQLKEFCQKHRTSLHHKIITQMNFERRIKKLRDKYANSAVETFEMFSKSYQDEKKRMDGIPTSVTGFSEMFKANKVYEAISEVFKKSYSKIVIPTKAGRNLPEVFKRHYGAFIENLISNHYSENSYSRNDGKLMRIGIKKLMRECDEKYEMFSKKV